MNMKLVKEVATILCHPQCSEEPDFMFEVKLEMEKLGYTFMELNQHTIGVRITIVKLP